MSEPQMWRLAGVVFLVAAALMFVNDSNTGALAFIAIGLGFLAMPGYTGSRRRKKP